MNNTKVRNCHLPLPCCWSLFTVCCLLLLAGCGRTSGPACYELSGSVTFNGKPVPAGYIQFAPDKSKGNDGPGSSAEIKDGVYRTRSGEGTVGGPHVATISGFDGKILQTGPAGNPMGKPLFANVQVSVDLPKQTATHDIVLPVQKAN